MRRAEDGVGIGKAVRAYVYRTWLTKERMCPPLFGCRTTSELCRVRGWDKNLPSRLLSTLPKRSWLKRLRRLGVEVLVPL
jgi:hypothetical protein